MRHYYVHYPRDFANEYTVFVVQHNDSGTLHALFPDAKRITRKEAILLGWTRPREAKQYGEQWYGGFAETGRDHNGTLNEVIDDAEVATDGAIRAYQDAIRTCG